MKKNGECVLSAYARNNTSCRTNEAAGGIAPAKMGVLPQRGNSHLTLYQKNERYTINRQTLLKDSYSF